MTKKQFIARFSALTAAEKAEITAYYKNLYTTAIMAETFKEAEKRLLWIREAGA